jgi:hypothetical protein
MGKYSPLKDFLFTNGQDYVPMTFAEIEKVLGLRLPASKRYPAWWSNNPSNNPMTKEWLEAGYETESVNTSSGKLVFRRIRGGRGGILSGDGHVSPRPRHSGFGFMKGLLTVEDGYDLTSPSDEDWEGGYLGRERQDG